MPGFEFPWPHSIERPMLFYHSTSNEEISASGTSFLNRGEVVNIEMVITAMFYAGLRPD